LYSRQEIRLSKIICVERRAPALPALRRTRERTSLAARVGFDRPDAAANVETPTGVPTGVPTGAPTGAPAAAPLRHPPGRAHRGGRQASARHAFTRQAAKQRIARPGLRSPARAFALWTRTDFAIAGNRFHP
jgi:hypothetical protein